MMRVLIVSAWDPKSGVLTVYRSLARHLSRHGVRFSAFAFDGWSESTWWTFCDELIDGRAVTLAQVLMSGRYDLLHCIDSAYSPPYGVETWVRRARFRGPVVLMSQSARRELSAPAHATRYVACSRDAADVLARDADGPVSIIANGYDEDVFRPGEADCAARPLLMWVGRSYDPQKDVDLFLDALEVLPEHDGILVDETSDPTTIRHRLDPLGARIQLAPMLTPAEMAATYRRAAASGGAYLCTSRYEGFLIAAAEAMACGCPVVAPRIPGLDHLVDGRNALVYDRSEGKLGVVEALGRLRDGSTRADIVRQGRVEAEERWTSRAMADAYLRLYEEALAAASARPRGHTVEDAVARRAWSVALTVRPLWHRARAAIRSRA